MSDTPFKNAYWIWDDGDPKPVNGYRVFRKSFMLSDDNTDHEIRITAQSQYRLSINGQTYGSGPAPSAKGHVAYDTYSVYLQPGYNVIEVEVHCIGIPIFSRVDNPGGMIFEMGDIVSDESWYVSKTSPWIESDRFSKYLGFFEVQDASKTLYSWDESDEIDPELWSPAKQIGITKDSESVYGRLEPRGTAFYRDPLKSWIKGALIGCGNCSGEKLDNIASRLEKENLLTLTSGTVNHDPSSFLKIEPSDEDIWLLYDFGSEVSGMFDFDIEDSSEDNAGAIVDIGYSEVYDPTVSPSGLIHGGQGFAYHYADRLVLSGDDEDWFYGFQSHAFRYVRVAIRGLKAPITVTPVGIHETMYPTENRGSFFSSDARLDKIWEIGRRTLNLCMADTFMDCPQRERAQYIGDTRIQAIGAQYCFGDTMLHKRFLVQTALGQHEDGSIDPCGPGEWNATNPNAPISGFMAIYVQSALDYYMHTGDGDTINEIFPAILKALGWLASFGGAEGGLITRVSGWNFTDWAPGLSKWNQGFKERDLGISAPLNLFYLQALRAAAYLADLAGDKAAATSCSTRATMVAGAFDSLFWSVNRGVYVDSVVDGKQSDLASQQTNCLALLCGIGSDVRKELILESLFDDESLTQIGSPYFSFYLIQALAKCGQHDQALAYIREKWGAMLDAGATSWWETWDGTKSRCHAWSIGPTLWLNEQILGVTPYEPGWACVNVAPKLCGLKWARGVVPTLHGDIQVAWKVEATGLTLDVTAPTGVHIRPIIPCEPTDLLIIDGEPIAPDSIVRRSKTYAEIAVLPGSGYRFEVVKRTTNS